MPVSDCIFPNTSLMKRALALKWKQNRNRDSLSPSGRIQWIGLPAKRSQVEMELKSLQSKISQRKEGGGSLNHKAHWGVRQAGTPSEVKESMRLTKNPAQRFSSSQQDKFMELSWTRSVTERGRIQRVFSKYGEHRKTTMVITLMKNRARVSPANASLPWKGREQPCLLHGIRARSRVTGIVNAHKSSSGQTTLGHICICPPKHD